MLRQSETVDINVCLRVFYKVRCIVNNRNNVFGKETSGKCKTKVLKKRRLINIKKRRRSEKKNGNGNKFWKCMTKGVALVILYCCVFFIYFSFSYKNKGCRIVRTSSQKHSMDRRAKYTWPYFAQCFRQRMARLIASVSRALCRRVDATEIHIFVVHLALSRNAE